MAVIHHTTLTPGKLELLAAWLPAQPWYARTGPQPELSRAGGFRLDDPDGEVGIEFMVVTDGSGDRPCIYHVPLSYRGAPLDGADDALIGTTEHGVLGTRWVYDGPRDPVLAGQLLALIHGEAEAQAQGVSNTPDRTVSSHFAGPRVAASLSFEGQTCSRADAGRATIPGIRDCDLACARWNRSPRGARRGPGVTCRLVVSARAGAAP